MAAYAFFYAVVDEMLEYDRERDIYNMQAVIMTHKMNPSDVSYIYDWIYTTAFEDTCESPYLKWLVREMKYDTDELMKLKQYVVDRLGQEFERVWKKYKHEDHESSDASPTATDSE